MKVIQIIAKVLYSDGLVRETAPCDTREEATKAAQELMEPGASISYEDVEREVEDDGLEL